MFEATYQLGMLSDSWHVPSSLAVLGKSSHLMVFGQVQTTYSHLRFKVLAYSDLVLI